MTSISELIREERATRKNSRVATVCRVVERNVRAFPVVEAGQRHFTGFRFLSVKTTRTSAQLAWTWAGNGTRYLVFAQESYGVYFTERSRFELVGLEPRKTYHVFVLAEGRGPEWIAFTSFETLE